MGFNLNTTSTLAACMHTCKRVWDLHCILCVQDKYSGIRYNASLKQMQDIHKIDLILLYRRISEAVTKADTNHSLNLSTFFKYLENKEKYVEKKDNLG